MHYINLNGTEVRFRDLPTIIKELKLAKRLINVLKVRQVICDSSNFINFFEFLEYKINSQKNMKKKLLNLGCIYLFSDRHRELRVACIRSFDSNWIFGHCWTGKWT